jgi:hypothetical protein
MVYYFPNANMISNVDLKVIKDKNELGEEHKRTQKNKTNNRKLVHFQPESSN